MCGILGLLNLNGQEVQLSEVNIKSLYHRGPDDYGMFCEDNICLGHTRLSIIDLSPSAKQPMSYGDRYVITYNGEIYNYLELKNDLEGKGEEFKTRSDTEVILAAYKKWGKNCLNYFRGSFAFALFDKVEKTLFIARDRCGERPFIYYFDNEIFAFASEIKALTPLLPNKPKLLPDVVDMYLHYQYVPEPYTLLENVRKLPAAHYALIKTKEPLLQVKPIEYWNLRDIKEKKFIGTKNEIDEAILNGIEDAVKMTLRSDVEVGVALSGGIDSSAIAVLAQKNYNKPMHAFSVGYPGRPVNDERKQAQNLAEKLGMLFHEIEIPTNEFVDFFPRLTYIMDEPIADPAAFGHYTVPKVTSEAGIKVLLSGIGGDELFNGYSWVTDAMLNNQQIFNGVHFTELEKVFFNNGIFRKVFSRSRIRALLPGVVVGRAKLFNAISREIPSNQLHFLNSIDDFNCVKKYSGEIYGPLMKNLDKFNAFRPLDVAPYDFEDIPITLQKLLFETWLISNCLTLGDRVSMSVGVETRAPFLDVNLVELVTSIRYKYPDHSMGHKPLLRSALKGILPGDVLNRSKRGFEPPVREWLLGVVKTYMDKITQGYLIANGYIDYSAVEYLNNNFEKNLELLFITYKLILLETWYDNL